MKKFLCGIVLSLLLILPVQAEDTGDSSDDNISAMQKCIINLPKKKMINRKDIAVSEFEGIYVIRLNTERLQNVFKPYIVDNLTTNKEVFDTTNARLVINAGFFDFKNQKTVSYVTIDGELVLNPEENENLTNNVHLKPYMDKILNRSEFRVLRNEQDKSLLYDIAPHRDSVPEGYKLVHAIQGGPGLVPDLRLEEEFFVLTDDDGNIINESASSLHRYARTLLGIKNNNVYFIIATTEHPVSLPEASEMLKNAGFEKAMAFDGGGSVSVDYRDNELHIISDKNYTARKLKSFFIVEQEKSKSVYHIMRNNLNF